MRTASVERNTKETQIKATLNIDGKGSSKIETPIGFFSHMLEAFTKHGGFDLELKATGDLQVDQHHTVEDTGIVLGQAFKQALGDKKGINRAGYFIFPMDESLAVAAIDISGRPYLKFEGKFRRRFCGELDTDLIEDFFYGFSVGLGANITLLVKYGRSDHHKIEATFKAFTKALKTACSKDERLKDELPSTKGMIEG